MKCCKSYKTHVVHCSYDSNKCVEFTKTQKSRYLENETLK